MRADRGNRVVHSVQELDTLLLCEERKTTVNKQRHASNAGSIEVFCTDENLNMQSTRRGVHEVQESSPETIACYNHKFIILLELDLGDIGRTHNRVCLEVYAVCKLLSPLFGAAKQSSTISSEQNSSRESIVTAGTQ